MGLFSNKISREDLKPGDHIYSWRTAYIYAHHGIYIGDGIVIHFTTAGGFSSSPASNCTICEKCGDQSRLYGVIRSCIDCFLAGGNLCIFEYAVSRFFFVAQARGGTCTRATSDTAEEVEHRAKVLLDKGFGMYNFFKNNCEDFAIYCKTGLLIKTTSGFGRSGQLASWSAAALSSPLFFLATGASGSTVAEGVLYSIRRYRADLGVRRDVIKIPVERLVIEAGAEEPQSAAGENG